MPVPPPANAGAPRKSSIDVPIPAVVTGSTDATPLVEVPANGYLTEAKILPDGTFTGAATNNRTWTVVDNSTRATSGDGNTTSGSAVVTSATAAFTADDVGKKITGTNIPALTTILSVQSATKATMSANATGTATTTVVTIGAARTLATLLGVSGMNLATGTAKAMTLSTTDTAIYRDDLLQLVSTFEGTGIADPGGTVHLEMTFYGEGTG